MGLLNFIRSHRIKLSPRERKQAGNATIMKYKDNSGKEKFAIHEQPALITTDTIKQAISKWKMLRRPFTFGG